MEADDLKVWRDAHNYSQTELAARLGISASTVRNWEQRRNAIPDYLDILLAGIDPKAPAAAAGGEIEGVEDGSDPARARRKREQRRARLEAQYGLYYANTVARIEAEYEQAKRTGKEALFFEAYKVHPFDYRVGGWAVTTFGIEMIAQGYQIPGSSIRDGGWIRQVRQKGIFTRECIADLAECLEYALTEKGVVFSDSPPPLDEMPNPAI